MHFLPEKLDDYIVDHSQKEPELLQQLSKETWQKVLAPRMLSGHFQGRVLSLISKIINPKYILEIGTYTGYSALCLAEGIQTILRREGFPKPYEALKELTRNNQKINKKTFTVFIENLEISDEIKKELKKISPFNYTGI